MSFVFSVLFYRLAMFRLIYLIHRFSSIFNAELQPIISNMARDSAKFKEISAADQSTSARFQNEGLGITNLCQMLPKIWSKNEKRSMQSVSWMHSELEWNMVMAVANKVDNNKKQARDWEWLKEKILCGRQTLGHVRSIWCWRSICSIKVENWLASRYSGCKIYPVQRYVLFSLHCHCLEHFHP